MTSGAQDFCLIAGGARIELSTDSAGQPQLRSWTSADGATLAPTEPAILDDAPELPASPGITPLPALAFFPNQRLDCPAVLDGHRGVGPVLFMPGSPVISRENDRSAQLIYDDSTNALRLTLNLALDRHGIFTVSASVKNTGDSIFHLGRIAACTLPLYDVFQQAEFCEGDWGTEGRTRMTELGRVSLIKETHDGRPGFDWANLLWLHGKGCQLFAHLAHGGDSRLRIDHLRYGGQVLMLEERLQAGEISLTPGDSYTSPTAILAFGQDQAALASALHGHLEAGLPRSAKRRPVHANSWEAVYIDVSEKVAKEIASAAHALGVERFILDDGWFKGRRDLKSGLGDWTPDEDKFPEGLDPLIQHVRGLSMEFGLWIEPEMVSPNSDLARTRPDWVLGGACSTPPTGRDQWVLDMGRQDVVEHLFAVIDGLLSAHDIAYLKWDHNRTLYPMPRGQHRQNKGFETLAARVKAAHPDVSLELCSSGGGRLALHLFKYFDRIWISDATDAQVRGAINATAFRFLPPLCVGTHIGPSPNPMTFARHSIEDRAAMAAQGHMGIELDPRHLSAHDAKTIRTAIATWKANRP